MTESEVVNRSLASHFSLLKLSVGRMYGEELSRILRHKLFNLTQFNETTSTLEDCKFLTKSMESTRLEWTPASISESTEGPKKMQKKTLRT